MKGAIHIGTSGWSYKHWRDRFYPVEAKPSEYLDFYRRYFDTTEVNTSFYHLPKSETVEHWAETVKKHFKFCFKMSRYITHMKKLNDADEPLSKFFKLLDPIRSKLGPVLIQLPPGLAFHEQKTETFIRVLRKYKDYRFALEPRHDSWFETGSVDLLQKHHIALVVADSGDRWPNAEYITARDVYVRFHGRSGYDSSYNDEFLRKFAEKMQRWSRAGHTIWAFFNNDGNAYAVYNAKRLIELTT